MDREKLRTILEAIPPGRWVSYADVAALGEPDAVRARLEAEGVDFDELDRAAQDQRVRPEPIGTVEAAESEPPAAAPA